MTLGFTVTTLASSLSLNTKLDCPNGFNQGPDVERLLARFPAEQRQAIRDNQNLMFRAMARRGPTGPNVCLHPMKDPDPVPFVMGASKVQRGLDLRASGVATCGDARMTSPEGQTIDNQFSRVNACIESRQRSGGGPGGFSSGAMTVLIRVTGVDSLVDDPDVRVGIYSSGDPNPLSTDRKVLSNATFRVLDDKRYQTEVRGRIRGGVLETDFTDISLRRSPLASRIDGTHHTLSWRGAKLRAKINADGTLTGMIGGYRDIEKIYNWETRQGTVSGNNAMGYLFEKAGGGSTTCRGFYLALRAAADGYRDPKTGQCGFISTNYDMTAVPAYVVMPRGVRQQVAGRGAGPRS